MQEAVPEERPRAYATAIRGTILGHDGTPLRVANLGVWDPESGEGIGADIGSDGTFSVDAYSAGLGQLEVIAVDHAALRLPLVLEGDPLEVHIVLGTYRRSEPLEELAITYWENSPTAEPQMLPLAEQRDGTWSVEVKTSASRILYQIVGTAGPGRAVNGPVADDYEPDRADGYRSVLRPQGGAFTVVIDPTKLPRSNVPVSVEWREPDGPSARVWRAIELRAQQHREIEKPIRTPAMERPQAGHAHDWSRARRAALAALAKETHARVRHVIIGEYFRMGEHAPSRASARDRELAAELLGDMPARDGGWELFPESMLTAIEISPNPRHRERYDALLDELGALAMELTFAELLEATAVRDVDRARRMFARTQDHERYGDPALVQAAKQYDPDGALAPGKTVPSFEVKLLHHGNTVKGTVTDEDLRGKVYLIDLWATWCEPCVAQMDELQAAHRRYRRGKRRFDILSISVDEDRVEIDEFLEWFPMPWEQTYVAFNDATKMLGVSRIPFTLLVDERGTILASGTMLSGDRLDAVLAEHLR